MSTNKGKHLGGVRTLADLKARCEEVGECWDWQLYMKGGKVPQTNFQKRTQPARRVAWELSGSKPDSTPQNGLFVSSTCGNYRCIAPHHLELITPQAKAKKSRANANNALRNARIAKALQASRGIPHNVVSAIRQSTEASPELANQLRVHVSTVQKIRAGTRHALPITQSPWAGLMGARA